MAAPVFTPGQLAFISRYAKDTGLNQQVVAAQVFNEMNNQSAAERQAAGNHNWLNIGWTDSGQKGTGNQLWMNPLTAADASARWVKGQWDVPGFGRAAPGIQGILKSAGQSPAAQIAALQNSGWASGRYPNLPSIYQSVSGMKLPNVPAGGVGGVPLSTGGPALPTPTLPTPTASSLTTPNLSGALLGSIGKGPGEQLNAVMGALLAPSTQMPGTETSSMPPAPSMPTAPQVPRAAQLPADVGKWASFAPGADRSGVKTNPSVLGAVARIGQTFGQPLTITTGTNHDQYVAGHPGRESQHWQGNAADIVYGHGTGPDNVDPALTRLGRAALVAAGMPPRQAAKINGGFFNVGGWNIGFNTGEGGNHYNHLHVGV